MDYYIITGTSRGIGKALADKLLESGNSVVLGISRTQTVNHQNYFHLPFDLSNKMSIAEFSFPEVAEAESICLVNNAAAITEYNQVGKLSSKAMIEDYDISLVAPALLCNLFLKQYQGYGCRRVILNVSSGASRRPLESSSIYCSAKAGLEMLSIVIDLEQRIRFPSNPVRVFSVMPGVVDTKMQEILRSLSEEIMNEVTTFKEYKSNNVLSQPAEVAGKLIRILREPESFKDVMLHVKDIEA